MADEEYNLAESILDLTTIVAANVDIHNPKEKEAVLNLLDCCEIALTLPKKRKRKTWTKEWKTERNRRVSFASFVRELQSGELGSFFNYIKMNEAKFNLLVSLVTADLKRQDTSMREAISVEEKLAATLRFLATGESYLSIYRQTKLSPSFLCHAVPEVCKSIYRNLNAAYLPFPAISDWEKIGDDFATKWQFPNCLGALDCQHINFRALAKDGTYYRNSNGTNSLILLALVDANSRFIFVDVGCSGRNNNADVFLQSKLKDILDKGLTALPGDKAIGKGRSLPYVVLGDIAFPLETHLMTPYPSPTKTKEEKIFNIRLSRARHVVKHAFSVLSNRFRILQTTMNVRVENVEDITLACCALQNFLMDDWNCTTRIPSADETNSNHTNSKSKSGKSSYGRDAEEIRQEYKEYFNREGQEKVLYFPTLNEHF